MEERKERQGKRESMLERCKRRGRGRMEEGGERGREGEEEGERGKIVVV